MQLRSRRGIRKRVHRRGLKLSSERTRVLGATGDRAVNAFQTDIPHTAADSAGCPGHFEAHVQRPGLWVCTVHVISGAAQHADCRFLGGELKRLRFNVFNAYPNRR